MAESWKDGRRGDNDGSVVPMGLGFVRPNGYPGMNPLGYCRASLSGTRVALPQKCSRARPFGKAGAAGLSGMIGVEYFTLRCGAQSHAASRIIGARRKPSA